MRVYLTIRGGSARTRDSPGAAQWSGSGVAAPATMTLSRLGRRRKVAAQHNGIGSAYFYVRDVDAPYSELVGTGADVQGEPVSQPWGLREFSVLDVERNRLTLGQTFE
jgi:hypothetical protein